MEDNVAKVKIPDLVIIILSLGLTVSSAVAAYINPQNASQVLIEGVNQKWIFPLDSQETVRVKGPLGETVVRIHEKEVWVASSPCSNQTCVAMGHVNRGWVACLPNNVFFRIAESDDSGNKPDIVAW